MAILKFITQEELDDLDDDPRLAFLELANLAQRRLSEQTDKLDPSDNYEMVRIDEINHSFMNVVVAAGKRLGIDPFTDMDVPNYREFSISDHREFQAHLDHYITQLMLDNRIRSKRDSVAISPQLKERIRTQIVGLRKCVEEAELSEVKREALLARLDEFEKEFEKRRLNMMSVTLFACQILAVPGGIWSSVEMVQKLTTTVIQIVAEAKATEDEFRKLPSIEPFKALSPPKKEISKRNSSSKPNFDLDDDIPF